MPATKPTHTPVLQKEVYQNLLNDQIQTVFDGTVGLGGHAEAILTQYSNIKKYIGCDLDQQHLKESKARLKKWDKKLILTHSNFSEIKPILQKEDFPKPIAILLDLGLCSNQIDDPEKGFCFHTEGPLKMTFDTTQSKNCEHFINNAKEQQLTKIFYEFGEEPCAKKIAKAITQARTHKPIKTTTELRTIIEQCTHPKDHKKTRTRIFQALRIHINQELDHLKKALQDSFEILTPQDRIGIISYHSLEDRIVKKFFTQKSKPETVETIFSKHEESGPATAKLITKKPITPSTEEIKNNPRSRSAKLRILEKI